MRLFFLNQKRILNKSKMKVDTFEVLPEQEGERLDKYLSIIYPDVSRSFFQKIIKYNNVVVNSKAQKANYRVKADEIIEVTIPDAVETAILPEDIPLDIIYEDADIIIVNKTKKITYVRIFF